MLAETIGMTAAAAAARGADAITHAVVALAVVVAVGLVEGTALGLAQWGVLSSRLPGLRRGAYVGATVLVAGLGWAAASAAAVLSSDDSGASPPLALVLLGAAGIGLVMGPVLGGERRRWRCDGRLAHRRAGCWSTPSPGHRPWS